MHRTNFILPLMSAALLLIVCSGRSKADTPDTAPGWVIILAADYQGANGPRPDMFTSVQHDAIRAYDAAVTKLHVPPNHILMLAEGSVVKKFASDGSVAATEYIDHADGILNKMQDIQKQYPATARSIVEQVAAAATDPVQVKALRDFEMAFMDGDGSAVPILADPTRDNFLLACKAVSLLSHPDQFVTMIVSTHGTGTAANKVAALKQTVAGTVTDDGCLDVKDFSLPNCKARARLLIIDSACQMKDEEISHPAVTDGGPFSQIQKVLATPDAAAFVLSSTDGSAPSYIKPAIWDSSFLYQLFNYLDPGAAESSVAAAFTNATSSSRSEARLYVGRKQALNIRPAMYPSAGDNSPKLAELVNYHEAVHTGPVTLIDPKTVAALDIASFGGIARTSVFVGTKLLATVTDKNGPAAHSRGVVVANAVKALLEAKLTRAELQQIRPGTVRKGGQTFTVVLLPDNVTRPDDNATYLVTADRQMASIQNLDPKELATQLSSDIRNWMSKEYVSRTAGEAPSARDSYGFAEKVVALNNGMDTQYHDAEIAYQKAIQISPRYWEAYLRLAELYVKQGFVGNAASQLDKLQEAMDDPATDLTPEQRTRMQALRQKAESE